ncbi:MAG: glutamyl-tRNA reductase [Fibrobacter sp.]|nr:glutamyl-tRNA reductase [Fibrobacter sp.]
MKKNKEKVHSVVLGVTYKTCPIEIRDALSLSLQDSEKVLKSLLGLPGVSEAVILNTCNRVEIYVATLYPEALRDTLINWWAEFSKLDLLDLLPYIFYWTHIEAVYHLYTVVSSIDSLVLGENQILAQVRNSFLKAQKIGSTGILLNHLFQSAIFVGKKVRECTNIANGTVSIAHAAVLLVQSKIQSSLKESRIALLGLGEMGRLAATALSDFGVESVTFFNRDYQKAIDFANRFEGQSYELKELPSKLVDIDVLICAVRSSHYVLDFKDILPRENKNLILIDIGAPRNVNPDLKNLENVELYCIDDLKDVVEKNRQQRKKASEEARVYIEDAATDFAEWFYSQEVSPLLQLMQDYHQKVGKEVLQKWEKKLKKEDFDMLKKFEHELRKKTLHSPFESIKMLSVAGLGLETQLLLEKIYTKSKG